VLGAAEHDPRGLQVHPDGLVLHPDAGLFGHVVGQTPKRPQRERQPQTAGTAPDGLDQPLTILRGYLARGARVRRVVQPLDPLGQVALEPAPYRLFACANDLGDLRRGQVLLGGQQDHLRARPQPRLAGDAVQLLQSVELLRA